MKDFTLRCKEIVQEAMKWAPQATRLHLQEYINRIPSAGTWPHANYTMAADSIFEFVDSALSTTAPITVRSQHCDFYLKIV